MTRPCSSSTSRPTASTRPASAGCAACSATSPTDGGTVLLSSHLLHEIEVVADDLVVIGNGRIVAQGAKSDLLASAGSIVRTTQPHVLADALDAAGITFSSVGTDGLMARADAERVGRAAFGAGVPVLELRAADGTGLEEMFLRLTADTQRDHATHQLEGALA